MRGFWLCCGLVVLCVATLVLAAELPPSIERVDEGVPGYDNTAIALGRGGETYVAAIKGKEVLLYTCRPGHVADRRRIAEVGTHPTMVTDIFGNVHLAYLDPQEHTINYVTNQTGSWLGTTVESNIADVVPSLTMDGMNQPHLTFVSNDIKKTLRHAVRIGEDWKSEPVETLGAVSGNVSLAVDVRNKIHLSYFNGGEKLLKYATNAEGMWKSVAVISPLATYGPWSSLAVDTRGAPHLAYFVTDPATNRGLLMYATNAPGPWVYMQADLVSEVHRSMALAVDLQGRAHIAYYDDNNQQLRYAANTTGEWTHAAVDKIRGMGLWPAITLDSTAGVHVSYLGESSLWHASFTQGFGSVQ